MADNVAITAGSGTTVAADEVVDGTLGTVKVQYVKIMDGTLDGTTKAAVGANGVAVNVGNAVSAIKVGDGTNNAAIKAASTAPAATDPALVVAISPNTQNANGQATMANSTPVVIASNQATFPVTATGVDQYGQYETVAASQTAQVLGATGATGDYLAYVTVFPGTAACGVVTILDNASTWGTFAGGGTTALPSLVPFRIDVGAFSTSGAWKITTGANVTCTGVGKFT